MPLFRQKNRAVREGTSTGLIVEIVLPSEETEIRELLLNIEKIQTGAAVTDRPFLVRPKEELIADLRFIAVMHKRAVRGQDDVRVHNSAGGSVGGEENRALRTLADVKIYRHKFNLIINRNPFTLP